MMIQKSICASVVLSVVVSFSMVPFASAHVGLLSPVGGEALTSTEVFTIRWENQIQHNTDNWDLWYSTDGQLGEWFEIALDLPAGDLTMGSIHEFEWTVPTVAGNNGWVRVQQDNGAGTSYFDISLNSFTILSSSNVPGDFDGNGAVDGSDFLAWQNGFGTQTGAQISDGDANGDGAVDGNDFLVWQNNFGTGNSGTSSIAVPEPATWCLGIVFLCVWFATRLKN